MKTIIAGGRNYCMTAKDVQDLDNLPISEVVSGGAPGADRAGELYAMTSGFPVKTFLADWAALGRAAGPIRNKAMAEYADAVVLFPGGRGTASMAREAEIAGIEIFDWRFNRDQAG